MARTSRLWLAAATLSLALVYWLPLWHIGLQAPEYPEGLGLYIAVNRIVGEQPQDLDVGRPHLGHDPGRRRILA